MGLQDRISSRVATIPCPHIDVSGAFTQPLRAIGGSLAAAAATANQALTVAPPNSNYGYITNLLLIPTAQAAVAATVLLLDSSGGTTLWSLQLVSAATFTNTIQFEFEIPIRTALPGGQFFVTTTGAGVTWNVSCNGFYGDLLNS